MQKKRSPIVPYARPLTEIDTIFHQAFSATILAAAYDRPEEGREAIRHREALDRSMRLDIDPASLFPYLSKLVCHNKPGNPTQIPVRFKSQARCNNPWYPYSSARPESKSQTVKKGYRLRTPNPGTVQMQDQRGEKSESMMVCAKQ